MAFREKSKPQRKFKAGMDADESKRRRDDVTVTLRREKREEQLSKRRMRGAGQAADDDDDEDEEDSKVMSQEVREALADIQKLVTMCKGSDSEQQVEAVTQFRKLLSIERNPPIKQIIDTGIVPRLVEFLTFTHNTTLQFEAAWALTNIASGSSAHTKTVVDHGAVQIFIHLLRSPSEDVREQTVWALGNIAGDNTGYRDMVLRLGALQPVLELCHTDAKVTMLRNATWTISNFCRGKPQPPFELVRDALPALALLIQSNDDEVLTDACWALSYLSDDNGPGNHKIQAVISAGVCRRLVELLMNRNVNVKTPALRTIGNIVTGDDLQTMAVLNCGVLTCLMALLINPKKGIRKEACWTISNITAGNTDQIQAVIEARLFPPLISMLRSAEFDIQKEASWAVSNATSGGSEDQIRYLVDQGVIEPLCELFKCADSKVILVAMEGIENILKVGLSDANKHGVDNKYADDVETCGGLDSLELLQKHTNEDVYDKALKILTTYFGDENEVTTAPAPTSGAGAFVFNAQQGAPSGGFKF